MKDMRNLIRNVKLVGIEHQVTISSYDYLTLHFFVTFFFFSNKKRAEFHFVEFPSMVRRFLKRISRFEFATAGNSPNVYLNYLYDWPNNIIISWAKNFDMCWRLFSSRFSFWTGIFRKIIKAVSLILMIWQML